MPPRDWKIRLRDILRAAEKIVFNTKNLDYESFSSDEWTVDAVLHNFTVIGEAARALPDETARSHPDIPWVEMSDMRNLVVHEYFGVDLEIVWNTIRNDLPSLIAQIKPLLVKRD